MVRHSLAAGLLALSVVLSAARADAQVAAGDTTGLVRIDLQEAIRRALQRAVPIALARAELARAEALLRQARAGWLPKLTGNASYTRLDHDRSSGVQRVTPRDQLIGDLRLTLPLVAAPRWVETSQAADDVAIARADAIEDRRRVALAVGSAYLAVMAQHRVVDVNQRALQNAKAHYDYAHTRFEGGIGNELDDVRAAQEYESNVARLEGAYAELQQSQEALGVLLGEDSPLDVVDTVQLAAAPELNQALADASERRPDVKANRERERSAQAALDSSWADYMPFLSAEFRPFLTSPGTTTLPSSGWQAQLLLAVPFYDGGLRYGKHDERAADLAAGRTQLEATLRQARSEVRVAIELARRADAALRSAGRAAELASRALQMAMQAYRAGATTDIEVLDAERRARDAETGAVVAEDAARQARLDLLAATGRWP
ncbi:MAG TPA: TolC family protein [Polyangiales bacterium]|nr:TolC family protein [Polyangiales bacterium]